MVLCHYRSTPVIPDSLQPALPGDPAHRKRSAIYCRVSTDESLGMEFNSIDAQREAGEACIASQISASWARAAVYEDPGFSGATLKRPALMRLLRDVQRHLIDVVVVHKIDRLTRNHPQFPRANARYDKSKAVSSA